MVKKHVCRYHLSIWQSWFCAIRNIIINIFNGHRENHLVLRESEKEKKRWNKTYLFSHFLINDKILLILPVKHQKTTYTLHEQTYIFSNQDSIGPQMINNFHHFLIVSCFFLLLLLLENNQNNNYGSHQIELLYTTLLINIKILTRFIHWTFKENKKK